MKTLTAFLLLCCTAWAQPTPTVTGPETVHPGEIVILNAGESDADFYTWAVDLSGVNIPVEGGADLSGLADALRAQGFEVTTPPSAGPVVFLVMGEKGDRLHLTSYAGSVYRVTLACSDATGVAITTHTVTVKGVAPEPEPPDPEPEPDPPEPLPTLTGLVAAGVSEEGGDSEEWKQLAALYELMSLTASSLDVPPAELVEMVKKASREVLSENLDGWSRIVAVVVGPHMNGLRDAGKLETAADHAVPFKQIADGIREGVE